jgi:hypothetical protein
MAEQAVGGSVSSPGREERTRTLGDVLMEERGVRIGSPVRTSFVVPSFNGLLRLAALLRSIEENDPSVLEMVRIFEDPCGRKEVREGYARLPKQFPGIEVTHLPRWSNLHGAAQAAFEAVCAKSDWIVYLGDDVLVTPFALTNMLWFLQKNELETVGLVQFPYWNASDLTVNPVKAEYRGPSLLRTKEEMYTKDLSWLDQVPNNPHWNGEGYARPYINVNGVGFAAHARTWEAIGGFSRDTWCIDECISVRVWLRSERGVVCLPGPPLVHYFAGASLSAPPPHDLDTEAAWVRGMKMSKKEAGRLSYEVMFQRSDRINEEMRRASYF